MTTIGGKLVGEHRQPVVIAEISANHGNSLDVLQQTVRGIALAGADVVKTQTYRADTLASRRDKVLYDQYVRGSMIWGYNAEVKRMAGQYGLGFLSTAYDPESADYLINLGVDAIKVSSFELVDLILLRHLGRARMPIVLSTGMATVDEIRIATRAYFDAGGTSVIPLYCRSTYPAIPSEFALRAGIYRLMMNAPDVVGLSDHTRGVGVACAAVTLGVRVIEKHVCLDGLETIDSSFSLPLSQFGGYVAAIRDSFDAGGGGLYDHGSTLGPVGGELTEIKYRKSLHAARDIVADAIIEPSMLVALRPAAGVSPLLIDRVVGSQARVEIPSGAPILASDLTWKD